MAKKVARYEDRSGNTYGTERDADRADAYTDIEEWVKANATNTEGDDPEVTADVIAGGAVELSVLLRKYSRLCTSEKDAVDG